MKIGFCGAGGVGKTTVAERVSVRMNLPLMKSKARQVLVRRGLREEDQYQMTPQEIWQIQKEMFEEKLEQDATKDGVFERTLLDHLSYLMFRCYREIDDSVAKSYEIIVKENMSKYDLVVFFPVPTWTPKDDGLRENRLSYRYVLDAIMRGYLKKFEVNHVVMEEGTTEEMAAKVLFLIE